MAQHPRPIITATEVNLPAPFSIEMVLGWQPSSGRGYQAPQPMTGAPVTQPVFPFSPDMTQGTTFPTNRAFPVKNQGWSDSQLTQINAPFSEEMVAGYHPDTARVFVERPLGWFTREPDVLFASIEETIGWHPDTPRLSKVALGPSFIPWSGTPNPFTPDMVQGTAPPQNRAFPVKNQGSTNFVFVDPFGIEMTLGWAPAAPRLFLGPRIPLPWSDAPSNVAAPFQSSMTAGWYPDTSRQGPVQKIGLNVFIEPPAFANEETIGWHPDTARFFMGPRTIGWQDAQLTAVAAPFSEEMVLGSRPDLPRPFFGPKPLGLQVAQTTHTSAPFTQDMVAGWHPDTNRVSYPHQIGQPLNPNVTTFIVVATQGMRLPIMGIS